MDRQLDKVQTHFHIRWNEKEQLDWECFHTRSEATGRAAEHARPNEEFTVEEVSAKCPLRGAIAAFIG
jgi:hypothetical protein